MMERGVPIVYRRVITAERELEKVALIEANNGAFYFNVEAGSRGSAGCRVRPGRHAYFTKEIDSGRKGGAEVQRELPLGEAAMRADECLVAEAARRGVQVRRREIDVGEAGDLERRIGRLRAFSHRRRRLLLLRVNLLHRCRRSGSQPGWVLEFGHAV